MHQFLQLVKTKHNLGIDDYPGLLRWSIENIAAFWEEVWQFCGIKASKPYTEVSRPRLSEMQSEISCVLFLSPDVMGQRIFRYVACARG